MYSGRDISVANMIRLRSFVGPNNLSEQTVVFSHENPSSRGISPRVAEPPHIGPECLPFKAFHWSNWRLVLPLSEQTHSKIKMQELTEIYVSIMSDLKSVSIFFCHSGSYF